MVTPTGQSNRPSIVRVSIDDSGMRRKMATLKRNLPVSGERLIASVGAEVARGIISVSPHDTGRYRRANEQAHNDLARIAGEPTLSLTPIGPSKRQDLIDRIETKLEEQLEWAKVRLKVYEGRKRSDERKPGFKRSWPSYRENMRKLNKQRKLLARAEETLAEFRETIENGGSIVGMFGRKWRGGDDTRLSTLTRVFSGTFGGFARVFRVGTKFFVTISNREPHARIVESRKRIYAAAASVSKLAGLRRAGKKYIKSLTESEGSGS